jgi:hypothetical protein
VHQGKYFTFLPVISLLCFFAVVLQFCNVNLNNVYNETILFSFFGIESVEAGFSAPRRTEKPEQMAVKAVYLTAYSASQPKKVDEIINLINKTELNAVVIDIKDYTGYVLYDSNMLWVDEFKTEKNILGDVAATIQKFHDNNIYVIARQTVFQDPVLAEKKPDWSIKKKGGGIWRDKNKLSWVDPTNESVWNYNLAIAKEAIRLGFDEINFDYVRFPSDGDLTQIVYTNGNKPKYEIMKSFFRFLNDNLENQPAWISIDVFGFVMERHDGMSIGQRLEDTVDFVDYVSPMMYPSHYPPGHLGLKNPAASPYAVIENGMKKGILYFEGKKAKVRPWLQAFNLGAVYGAKNIKAQIDAVEKYSDGGWMLWNAANKYTDAGLKLEE